LVVSVVAVCIGHGCISFVESGAVHAAEGKQVAERTRPVDVASVAVHFRQYPEEPGTFSRLGGNNGWFGVAVTAFVTSTKLRYVEPS